MPLYLVRSYASSFMCNGILIALDQSRGHFALTNRTLKYLYFKYGTISFTAVFDLSVIYHLVRLPCRLWGVGQLFFNIYFSYNCINSVIVALISDPINSFFSCEYMGILILVLIFIFKMIYPFFFWNIVVSKISVQYTLISPQNSSEIGLFIESSKTPMRSLCCLCILRFLLHNIIF